jgi:hypothetical protein
MSPDALALSPLQAPGDRRRATQLARRKGAPFTQRRPDRNNSFTSEHFAFVVGTPGAPEQVPGDLLSQVDYDWLVVDTNCSTDHEAVA